jgi:putative flavoprotein involved in K+ transport
VLIVGASATGVQLADEIHRSGRPVTLSVGEHVRLPRTYRGRDVLWWMDASGVWNQRYDEIDDLTRARKLPSPQLIGTAERTTLDLNALSAMGVALVGRLAAIRDGRALFSGGLRNQFALADLKMERLLDAFDEWARSGIVAAQSRSRERQDPFDCLGDWFSSGLPVAQCPCDRREGSPSTHRWRRRCTGNVCVRPSGPAPAKIQFYSRCRR